MYQSLTFFHSLFRWLVLVSLLYSIYRSTRGVAFNLPFSKTDDTTRHTTATISHIQLLIGMILYFQSPIVRYFLSQRDKAGQPSDFSFFGLVHPIIMFAAVVFITIGSSVSKRRKTDRDKFRILLIWCSVALLLILMAIPWPFSPFANRPYFR